MKADPSATPDPARASRRVDHRGIDFDAQEARYGAEQPALLVAGDSLGLQWSERELCVLGLEPIAKLAVNGDLTQHIVWRLQHTAIDLSQVQLAVVIAGTNNLSDGDGAEDIFRGVLAIVQVIRQRSPASRICVVQPPPRLPRRRYDEVQHRMLNALIDAKAPSHGYLAVQAPPLDPTDERLYRDGLHLYRRAYRLITAAVADALARQGALGPAD